MIHITIYTTFDTKFLPSFHCHVCMMYDSQLYKIIVIDNAIIKESSTLVTLTIIDGPFFTRNHHLSISNSVFPSITFFHTLLTDFQTSIVAPSLTAGSIICRIKSSSAFTNHAKNGTSSKANNQYFNLLVIFHIKLIYYI